MSDEALSAFERAYGISRDGQIHMGPLAVDGMPDSEILILCDHPGVHVDVKAFGSLTLAARRDRLVGRIVEAARLEAHAEAVYAALPAALRW